MLCKVSGNVLRVKIGRQESTIPHRRSSDNSFNAFVSCRVKITLYSLDSLVNLGQTLKILASFSASSIFDTRKKRTFYTVRFQSLGTIIRFHLLRVKCVKLVYRVYAASASKLAEIVSKFQSLALLRHIYNDISRDKKKRITRWKELFVVGTI